jgi:membrane peptidoglycan carboxypeptidase
MKTRSVLTKGDYSASDYDKAKEDPVVLVPEVTPRWLAPHFVWQVREEMSRILCGDQAESCPALETGGYKIVTTLDLDMQKVAEKWVKAATIVPKAKDPRAAAKAIGMAYQPWMQRLRGENVWNGALIAMDYRDGEVMAYVGSADYYAAKSSKRLQPKFDVLADGWRQPGSAFKPVHYSIGIDSGALTAATGFMDVTTDFGGGWAPTDSDNLERGPVRLRGALQWSLNIPAVKAMYIEGEQNVFAKAQQMGVRFQGDQPTAGLSFGIGTEVVHPADLTQAYGTIANGGDYVPRVTVLTVTDPNGKAVYTYKPPKGTQVISPQAAYIMTDILKGNTNPEVNPTWGRFKIMDGSKRRPATLKTGTNDEARDLGAYGFIAPSKDDKKYPSLVVGVWNGNSDYSILGKIFSFDAPTYVWQGFLKEVTKGWPISDWKEPDGIVHATVDVFSGMRPGPYSRQTVDEIFIEGTVPKKVDDTKVAGCGGSGVLDFSRIEADKPASWQVAIEGWEARARQGAGVAGGVNEDIPTKTAYFAKPYYHPYGETWGASFGGDCHGNPDKGNGNGDGSGPGGPVICHGRHCKPRRQR